MPDPDAGSSGQQRGWSRLLVGGGIAAAVVLGAHLIGVPFYLPSFLGTPCEGNLQSAAPFVRTPHTRVRTMIRLAEKYRSARGGQTRLIDLGSGDGRLVIEAATCGYRATGYELNPWLALVSKIRVRRAVRSQRESADASIVIGDFWNVHLAPYDVVAVYAIPGMMDRLRCGLQPNVIVAVTPHTEALLSELHNDALVLSHQFDLPQPWKVIESTDSPVLLKMEWAMDASIRNTRHDTRVSASTTQRVLRRRSTSSSSSQ